VSVGSCHKPTITCLREQILCFIPFSIKKCGEKQALSPTPEAAKLPCGIGISNRLTVQYKICKPMEGYIFSISSLKIKKCQVGK
jgi:hypothetical protein